MATLDQYRTLTRMTAKMVRDMREEVFGDDVASACEARRLIALGKAVPEGDREWPEFYCEALTDWAVRQEAPQGYVSEANAKALIDMLGAPEEATELELDLLAHLFHHARAVPHALTVHALACVRAAVLADGKIAARECRALRRFLYAPGGEGRIGITKSEAELVFEINDHVRDAQNDPEWPVLFRQAVTAFVMSHCGYDAPDRGEALRLEEFMRRPGGVEWQATRRRGFLARAFGTVSAQDALARYGAERAADERAGQVLTPAETAWLVDRLHRDGVLDTAERALLLGLRDLTRQAGVALPPALAALAG